ncbi:MAG: DUF1501 domain-containing protein [Planctomycetes bacterium]|nr:DUF1501 domain-containing protein [Planctomycetota bacterium]
MPLTRRELLRMSLATGVAFAMPSWLSAAGASPSPTWTRRLVLVELDGGNDGLNTIIPYDDYATYDAKRPTLAVPESGLRALAGVPSIRLNYNLVDGPGSERFRRLWNNGELAIALGVGMPDQSRSHFRGIDVWNSGSSAGTVWNTGWLQRSLTAAAGITADTVAHGAILSRTTSNPLAGPDVNVLALSKSDPWDSYAETFIGQAEDLAAAPIAGTEALQHVLRVQSGIITARSQLDDRFAWDPLLNDDHGQATAMPVFTGDSGNALFPSGDFGNQCRAVAQMIAADVGIPVYKIHIGGFDNHAGQRAKHDDLLAQLAHGLTGLRDALQDKGRLADTLIMTYSEFGRRVEENGSAGTDHGTLAPHVLISDASNFSGANRLHGTYPSLTALDGRGDLAWVDGTSIDYRRLYATALRFLGMPEDVFDATYAPLTGLLTA